MQTDNTSTSNRVPRFGQIYGVRTSKDNEQSTRDFLQEQAKAGKFPIAVDYVNKYAPLLDTLISFSPPKPKSDDVVDLIVHTGVRDKIFSYLERAEGMVSSAYNFCVIKPWAKPLMNSGLAEDTKKGLYGLAKLGVLVGTTILLWPIKLAILTATLPSYFNRCFASNHLVDISEESASDFVQNEKPIFDVKEGEKTAAVSEKGASGEKLEKGRKELTELIAEALAAKIEEAKKRESGNPPEADADTKSPQGD